MLTWSSHGAAQVRYIDTHAHLHGNLGRRQSDDFRGAALMAIRSMDQFGAARMIVMPPPLPASHPDPFDAETLLAAVKDFLDRFAVMGGGGTLNPMIHEAARAGSLSDALRRRFIAAAERLAALPIVGFGEMTAEHFSFSPIHPYVSAPADHPLFLALADVAAKNELPIELHMEAVATATEMNPRFRSPPNPSKLEPNIPQLERLLSHNRKTRIVWSHLGWDNTGQRTPGLLRRLFAAHPNLYVNIKAGGDSLPQNRIATRQGGLNPAWRAVIVEHSDRFLAATDQFHVSPLSDRRFPQHAEVARVVLDGLPEDVARRVGLENPITVFPRLGK